ncbi:MAG: STAS domain-containing protein [Planctomycetota bacterium]|nr:STAS domain-containing protein [Planctomycetota bacterium]
MNSEPPGSRTEGTSEPRPRPSSTLLRDVHTCLSRDGRLKVVGALDRTAWAAFEKACEELVARTEWTGVELDFSECTYLSSLFIGMLVGTYMKIEKQGRTIALKVSPEVARFLDMAHLNEVMRYEVAERRRQGNPTA